MTREELRAFRTDVTAKISDICRFIGLGLIAVFYTIKSGTAGKDFGCFDTLVLYVVGVAGVVAILLDYLQYVFSYRAVEAAMDSESLLFDKTSRSYRYAELAFKFKQGITIAGAVALIILVLVT